MEAMEYSEILKGEIEPSSKLFVLFVPSKDKNGNHLNDQDIWATAASEMFTRIFGGATEMPPAKGKWLNDETGAIITENVVLVHSYAPDSKIVPDNIQKIADFCHRMGRDTSQGEIALLVDGVFHRMRDFHVAT